MRLQQAVDRGFRNKVLLLFGEYDCQLPRRQFRLLEPERNNRFGDGIRESVPDPARRRLAIFRSFGRAPALRARLRSYQA
jgi:hypothetical protein